MDDLVGDVTKRTWVVLCNPADPRNVGGVIRVVANFGFKGLRVVTSKTFDERDLLCFSSEASERVTVEFYPSLDEGLKDQHFVLGNISLSDGLVDRGFLVLHQRGVHYAFPCRTHHKIMCIWDFILC